MKYKKFEIKDIFITLLIFAFTAVAAAGVIYFVWNRKLENDIFTSIFRRIFE